MNVRIVVFVTLAGWVAACGASPTSPPQPAPVTSLSGDWSIDFVVDSCTGDRQCVHSLRQVRTLFVRLVDEEARLVGAFNVGGTFVTTTSIQGTKQGREIVVAGYTPAAFPGVVGSYAVEVTKFRARLLTEATGEVEYVLSGLPQGGFFGRMVVTGTIIDAQKVKGSDATLESFAGRWLGQVAVRSCSVSGWNNCYPLQAGEMTIYELVLSESGTSVSGTMRMGSTLIQVEGEAHGSSLTLRGVRNEIVSGGRSVETILAFTATRDKVGFLRGTFKYKDQYLMNDGRENQTTYDAIELWSVLLR